MRTLSLVTFTLVILFALGCKKDDAKGPNQRTIKFELFTDQDFSNETNSIVFEAVIKDGNTVLWDSTFNSMAIRDIPSAAHKITFEKTIVNNNAKLAVGFKYTIPGVGNSWYYEQALPNEKVKTLSFNFK